MRDNHIIQMLEEKPFGSLGREERETIESHIADCSECRQAHEAARISSALITARAAETTEVSPFFKTRVMAALRERQLQPEPPALVRMWRAAGGLVSAMAAMVVILVGLTVFAYGPDSQPQPELTSQNIYSPEYLVFEQDEQADDGLAYDQVLTTIYDSGDPDEQ
jgi:predicted anti-sigma-YlaC factor YlaD